MVEWDGLENRCGRKFTVGSNPTLSAILRQRHRLAFFISTDNEVISDECTGISDPSPGKG